MNIAHEIRDVKVVRCRTIAEALIRGGCYKQHVDIVSGLMHGTFRIDNFNHSEMLYESLANECEGDHIYFRTCALASFDKEMSVAEFYRVIDKEGYYPASISEGVSYLSKCTVAFENVIHLGTFIRDDEYYEQRLLTRGNGKIEFVRFFSATKLKTYYHVVVVKKEKGEKR